MKLVSLLAPQQQKPVQQSPVTAPAQAPADIPVDAIDSNHDGVITKDELCSYFQFGEDGSISITPDQFQALSERVLDETLLVPKDDVNVDIKAKDALKRGEDVNIVDPNSIERLKLKEYFQRVAGIIK